MNMIAKMKRVFVAFFLIKFDTETDLILKWRHQFKPFIEFCIKKDERFSIKLIQLSFLFY